MRTHMQMHTQGKKETETGKTSEPLSNNLII